MQRAALIGAAVLWITLGSVLAAVAVSTAAVSVPGLAVLLPLSIAAAGLGFALLVGPPSRWIAWLSIDLGMLLAGLTALSMLRRLEDDGAASADLAVAVAALAATTFSACALWGMRRASRDASAGTGPRGVTK